MLAQSLNGLAALTTMSIGEVLSRATGAKLASV